MRTILFDTDYLIEFLRGNQKFKETTIKALSDNIGYISILSTYELYAGMRPSEEEATEDLINAFKIEPVTLEISKSAGKKRFYYRQKGITLSIVDCIISETAKKNNHLVATMNRKDYPDNEFLNESYFQETIK